MGSSGCGELPKRSDLGVGSDLTGLGSVSCAAGGGVAVTTFPQEFQQLNQIIVCEAVISSSVYMVDLVVGWKRPLQTEIARKNATRGAPYSLHQPVPVCPRAHACVQNRANSLNSGGSQRRQPNSVGANAK